MCSPICSSLCASWSATEMTSTVPSRSCVVSKTPYLPRCVISDSELKAVSVKFKPETITWKENKIIIKTVFPTKKVVKLFNFLLGHQCSDHIAATEVEECCTEGSSADEQQVGRRTVDCQCSLGECCILSIRTVAAYLIDHYSCKRLPLLEVIELPIMFIWGMFWFLWYWWGPLSILKACCEVFLMCFELI